MSSTFLYEASMEQGRNLAESKWQEWVGDIKNEYMRIQTANLLENQDRYNKAFVRSAYPSMRLNEDTLISHPGLASLEMQSFPMVRGMLPNLISSELVNVQTMNGPYAPIHYMVAKFGRTKGSINKGDNLFENFSTDYTGETVDNEIVGSGDTSTTPTISALVQTPIRPGSVLIYGDTEELRDNSKGGFVRSDTGASVAGAINYSTGIVTGLTFPTGPSSGATITATYEWNSEGSDNVPDIDLSIVSTPVVARNRKVKYRYSVEAQMNLDKQFGMDLDAELTQQATQLLRWEQDREVLRDLRKIAAAGTVEFKKNAPVGVSYPEHAQSFINALTTAGNLIFSATQHGRGTWLVMSPEVANIVETLPGFVPSGLIGGRGPVKAGVLNGQWVCYKDPDPSFANQFLVGYKGESWLETGYVLAPYIAYMATDRVTLDDFLARKGVGVSYGKRAIQPKYFCKGVLTDN